MNWSLIVAVVVASATVLTAVIKLTDATKKLMAPFRQFISEHDVLWEDYNIRVGGSYRRSTGRGAPIEPEEFYKTHHNRPHSD